MCPVFYRTWIKTKKEAKNNSGVTHLMPCVKILSWCSKRCHRSGTEIKALIHSRCRLIKKIIKWDLCLYLSKLTWIRMMASSGEWVKRRNNSLATITTISPTTLSFLPPTIFKAGSRNLHTNPPNTLSIALSNCSANPTYLAHPSSPLWNLRHSKVWSRLINTRQLRALLNKILLTNRFPDSKSRCTGQEMCFQVYLDLFRIQSAAVTSKWSVNDLTRCMSSVQQLISSQAPSLNL